MSLFSENINIYRCKSAWCSMQCELILLVLQRFNLVQLRGLDFASGGLEGQLHYLVGAGDLGQQDVAAGLRQQSGIHN